MLLINRFTCAAVAAVAVLLSGCGQSTGRDTTAAGPTPFDVAAAKAQAVSEATTLAAEDVAAEAAEAQDSKIEETLEKVVYEPPFPDRIDMFEPRKRAARAAKRSSGDVADSVVLMGFATLDEPKVVLAIDGIVSPLANGQEYGGVTVISIAPPRAVLQRGRSRWTASIE